MSDQVLHGRKRVGAIVVGSLFGLSLGFCFMLLIYGLSRWEDALVSTLWLAPIPFVVMFLSTRPNRQRG